MTCGLTRQPLVVRRWVAVAAVIWASYAAGLGAIFGNRFKDNHTVAFLLAFGAALSITIIIEVVGTTFGTAARSLNRPRRHPPGALRRTGDATHTLSGVMLAVIPVRDGVLPAGGAETVAECGGRALLAGSWPRVDELAGIAGEVRLVELGDFAPGPLGRRPRRLTGRRRRRRAPGVAGRPRPRPRLAHRARAAAARRRHAGHRDTPASFAAAGCELVDVADRRSRGRDAAAGRAGRHPDAAIPTALRPVTSTSGDGDETRATRPALEVLPPDVATMDLAEADRIVGGGAGLDGADRFRQLADVAGRSVRRWARPG